MNPRHRDIEMLLPEITETLASDRPLPSRHRDHNLGGNWQGHRECHVKPNLLLIDKKPDQKAASPGPAGFSQRSVCLLIANCDIAVGLSPASDCRIYTEEPKSKEHP